MRSIPALLALLLLAAPAAGQSTVAVNARLTVRDVLVMKVEPAAAQPVARLVSAEAAPSTDATVYVSANRGWRVLVSPADAGAAAVSCEARVDDSRGTGSSAQVSAGEATVATGQAGQNIPVRVHCSTTGGGYAAPRVTYAIAAAR